MSLEQRALEWIDPYWNAEHLVRTRDWARELEPGAGEALLLAALTHDMERHFPGGPHLDVATQPPDDRAYREAHSERSARIVSEWLTDPEGLGAVEGRLAQDTALGMLINNAGFAGYMPFIRLDPDRAEELILLHEWGGYHAADVLQAADSISFLEVNDKVVAGWVREGLCSTERGVDQLRWMYERIRLPGAQERARPFYEQAVALVEGVPSAA